MPFIGNQPAESYSAFQKQDFTTSATTSYTLDHPVANQNELALFINFVRQEPTAAYTASGTSLTLTSATSVGDDMYCVYLGKAVQTVNPPSGSVGSSQVAASIITGQTALASEPADTDEFLVSDAGTLKRIDYSLIKGGGITVADQWRLTANQELTADDVTANLEQVDTAGQGTIGTAMSQSSGIFTFPSTGIYMVRFDANFRQSSGAGGARYILGKIKLTTNNSSYVDASQGYTSMEGWISNTINVSTSTASLIDVTDTANVKVKFSTDTATASNFFLLGDSTKNVSTFSFTRLGDT